MSDTTIATAQRIAAILESCGAPCVVIGAAALAVHHYARAMEDLNLAVAVSPRDLRAVAERLREQGWDVQLRESDGNDPLGGVIDAQAEGARLVQIVNFDNSPAGGFPRLVHDAVARATCLAGTQLRVADPYMLVAFKLYAGGPKSALDILELLSANDLDLVELERVCASLRLHRLLARVLMLRE